MKTLTEFKSRLKAALKSGELVKTAIFSKEGKLIRQNEPTTLDQVITTGFSLKRKQGASWVQFKQATAWEFSQDKATQTLLDGKMVIEFIKSSNTPHF